MIEEGGSNLLTSVLAGIRKMRVVLSLPDTLSLVANNNKKILENFILLA
jgi:hypothetical protein